MSRVFSALLMVVFLSGCAGMSTDDKRMLFLGGVAAVTAGAVIVATDGKDSGPGSPTGDVGSGLGGSFGF